MLYVVTARETTDGERRAFRRKGWTRSPMVTTSLGFQSHCWTGSKERAIKQHIRSQYADQAAA